MDNYMYLKDYKALNDNKIFNIVFINLLIIILFIVDIGYIFLFIKYDNYYINEGFILDNKLIIYVSKSDIKYIINGKSAFINGEKNNYKVYSISEDNYNFNNKYFKEVKLSITLNDKTNYDYNVVDVKINIYHDRIFNYFFNKMRGNE